LVNPRELVALLVLLKLKQKQIGVNNLITIGGKYNASW
jgi:hypothetical protein